MPDPANFHPAPARSKNLGQKPYSTPSSATPTPSQASAHHSHHFPPATRNTCSAPKPLPQPHHSPPPHSPHSPPKPSTPDDPNNDPCLETTSQPTPHKSVSLQTTSRVKAGHRRHPLPTRNSPPAPQRQEATQAPLPPRIPTSFWSPSTRPSVTYSTNVAPRHLHFIPSRYSNPHNTTAFPRPLPREMLTKS